MKKKILFLTVAFVTFFSALGFLRLQSVNADIIYATGWLWGGSTDSVGNPSGVGWISMFSGNENSGGGAYMVNIPNADGPFYGYAWSSNYGWLDFNPQDHCTTGTPDLARQQYKAASCTNPDGTNMGVVRQGAEVKGWARFVSIAEASAEKNSGGWEGWIKMDANPSLGYKVSIVPSGGADTKMQGYAWSDEIGALEFTDVTGPPSYPPELTLDANPSYAFLEPGETIAANPKTVNLSWTISGQEIQSCARSCEDGSGNVLNCSGWTGNTVIANSNTDVVVPALTTKFKMTCTDKNTLSTTVEKIVNYGCSIGTCNAIDQTCQAHTGAFNITSSGDASVCKGGCTADSDCVLRQGSNWREVAP